MVATRLAAVGAFVLGGLVLFAVGLFFIGERRMLFGNTFVVFAEFQEVANLDNGATVRVAGMQAGEVEAIHVPAGPTSRFRVRMRVRNDLHPLVRTDSVASIQNDGLVGNKFVQIEAGSEQAALLPEGGTIQSREPIDIADLMEKLRETVEIVDAAVSDIRTEAEEALNAISDAARSAHEVVDDVGRDAREILAAGDRVSKDIEMIVAGIREGKGTVGQLLTDDALYQRAKGIAAEAERTMSNIRQATEEAKQAMADLRGEEGPVKGLAGDMHRTLASARDAMSDLAEATEALKRSFLFRGFFNRRGYFDLDDVTVQQYREGALDTRDRRALRIWLGAAVLFETDPQGVERLSTGGRARLDSAMSQFLKYPKTSPFVVEGYARAVTGDERFLLSRRRGQMVRDYIVGKFGLDPGLVAVMPMGEEAEGAPDSETWDGVALAMFVPAAAP
jgi:phospholipid/cholesterol/gamma-HCH transport system substrate-binding protein